MSEHKLKTWPNEWEAVRLGEKHFEYRRDDRGFEVGDTLLLFFWNPNGSGYRETRPGWSDRIRVRVTYVLRDGFGVPPGFCVMSIEPIRESR